MIHARPTPRVLVSSSVNVPRFARAFLAAALGLVLGGLSAPRAVAQYTFRTISGVGITPGNLNGNGGSTALATQFSSPFGITVAGDGTLYVSDNGNSVIRKITPAGAVTTFVGTPGVAGENNASTSAPDVTFNLPQGVAVDASGNLYVADYGGATVRKVTSSGTVSTYAGVASTTGYLDGKSDTAKFYLPSAVAVDSAGNVYVADSGNHVIRKVASDGTVSTLAGLSGAPGSADGKGTAASFRNPRGIAVDSNGNVYVADTGNNTLRKIAADGTVTTLAGTPVSYGSVDASSGAARFNFPSGIAVDKSGNVYVADQLNHTIRKVTAAGAVTTLAGLPGGEGRVDGQGSVARFNRPTSVAVDDSGTVYVADYGNQLIRKVSASGLVSTIAGSGGVGGLQNGTGYVLNPTLFQNPTHAVVDSAGNVFLTDTGNNSIRKVATDGSVSLFAGAYSGASGSSNGTGTGASFSVPSGLARDSAGNLYVADSGNQLIRKVTTGGVVTTFAGLVYQKGSADGSSSTATFNNPSGVAVDGSGNVYVADYSNHTIRKVDASGNVSTLAGSAGASGSSDGTGSAARFNFPRDLALDAAGNLLVADSGNQMIRKVTPAGVVTTVAGSPEVSGTADGTGSAARFNGPVGITVDGSGNIFVADSNNSTIRLISAAGAVSTIGGTAGTVGTTDGVGTAALFNHPTGVTLDASGYLYIVDNRNNTLRGGGLNGGTGGIGGTGSGSGSGSGGSGSGSGSGGGNGSGSGSGGTGSGSGSGNGGSASGGAYDSDTSGTGILSHPVGVVADSSGNYYVADAANHCIRKISTGAVTTVFAGALGASGSTDGNGGSARFNNPTALAIDSSGNLYVADTGNSTIRKITSGGDVTTLAGSAGQIGTSDGTGSAARFNAPQGVAIYGASTDVYVADTNNNTIRKITSAGVVTTYAGMAGQTGEANGLGNAARFNHPTGLTFDLSSNLIVADTYNHTIRTVTTTARTVKAVASGTIATAGNLKVVITDPNLAGSPLAVSVAVAANDAPAAWAAKVSSALAANTTITARYTPSVSDTTISLTYVAADDGTTANLALLNDTATGINEVTTSTSTAPAGTVYNVAGSAGVSGAYDGRGEYALFNLPQGLTLNSSTGAVFIADTGNSCIRRVTTDGAVVTIAGISTASGRRSGAGEQALFNQPQGLMAISSNALVVADTGNSVLRGVTLLSGAAYDSKVTQLAIVTSSTSGGSSGGGNSGGSSGGGGGGGAPSTWFIAAVASLAFIRRLMRRES